MENNNNNSNLDLFIATHKDFNVPVTDNTYKIITLNKPGLKISNTNLKIYDDTKGYNISKRQHGYSELSALYYVYRNLPLKDYIGFNHYRRYFPFNLNVNEIFKNYDIITPVWYSFDDTVENIFKMYHFEDDIILIEYIIKKYFPDYADDYDKHIKNNKNLYPYNMFIMKSEDFKKYCDFLFFILFKFDEINHINSNKDLYDIYKDKLNNLKNPHPYKNLDYIYQSRIHGFLGERLFTLYVLHNFNPNKIFRTNIFNIEKKENY